MLTPALTGQPSAPRLGTTQPAGWLDMRAEPMAGQAQGQPEGHLGNPSPKLGERVLQATWGQAASSTLHPKLGISHLCAPHTFLPSKVSETCRFQHLFRGGLGPREGGDVLRTWGEPTTHTLGRESECSGPGTTVRPWGVSFTMEKPRHREIWGWPKPHSLQETEPGCGPGWGSLSNSMLFPTPGPGSPRHPH